MKNVMNRREMVRLLALGSAALGTFPFSAEAAVARQTRLGVDMNSYGTRWSLTTPPDIRFKNVLDMLEHCHGLGAGGIQARIELWENEFVAKVRVKLESSQMYLEGQIGL